MFFWLRMLVIDNCIIPVLFEGFICFDKLHHDLSKNSCRSDEFQFFYENK